MSLSSVSSALSRQDFDLEEFLANLTDEEEEEEEEEGEQTPGGRRLTLSISAARMRIARRLNIDPISLLFEPNNRYFWCSTLTDVVKVSEKDSSFNWTIRQGLAVVLCKVVKIESFPLLIISIMPLYIYIYMCVCVCDHHPGG